jgi:hypothetical protein
VAISGVHLHAPGTVRSTLSPFRAQYEKLGKKANRQPFRVAVSDFYAGKNLLKK